MFAFSVGVQQIDLILKSQPLCLYVLLDYKLSYSTSCFLIDLFFSFFRLDTNRPIINTVPNFPIIYQN